LKRYDIILGVNWLKIFSPNILDWHNKAVHISHNGSSLTLTDHQVRGKDCVISAKSCSKLLLHGAEAFILQLNLLRDKPKLEQEKQETQLPISKVNEILQQFPELFEDPTGLPP
jgi:hypothetical protein